MRNLLLSILCVTFVSCNTDMADDVNLDNATYNQKIVEYLQNKYDVKAEIYFSPTYNQRLTSNEVKALEDYYNFIGSLKRPLGIALSDGDAKTRTNLYTHNLTYRGDQVTVYVYYETDPAKGNKELGTNPCIEVGIGGQGNHEYNIFYDVVYYNAEYVYGQTYIKVGIVRGDYVLKTYPYNYIGIPMTSVNPTMVVKSKIAAYGDVDITKRNGNFFIQYAGDGTWFTFDVDGELGLH